MTMRRVFIPHSGSIRIATAIASLLLLAATAGEHQLRVMTSGAFIAAYLQLLPDFEKANTIKVQSAFGASTGEAPDAIPNRIDRGEAVDVVIVARPALDALTKRGKIVPESCVDLVRSSIGMVVRSGAPKPDITSVEALKQTLLAAKSVTYSDSTSGIYVSTELFARLKISEQMKSKVRKIPGQPVGKTVANGEAEIGFQQVSELLSVPGVDYVGPLPAEVQRITIFSAGIAVNAEHPEAARKLIEFLQSPLVEAAIRKSGLDPIPSGPRPETPLKP